MHHWEKGGPISIGWPDHDVPEREYTIVEAELLGQVFRSRVTDGKKEGGFLVVFDCPEVVISSSFDPKRVSTWRCTLTISNT